MIRRLCWDAGSHRPTGTRHVCMRKAFSLIIYRVMPWTLNHTHSALKRPISSPKHTSFCPEQWTNLILPWNIPDSAMKYLVRCPETPDSLLWNIWFCRIETPGSAVFKHLVLCLDLKHTWLGPEILKHLILPWNAPDSVLKRTWFCPQWNAHLIIPLSAHDCHKTHMLLPCNTPDALS